MNNTTQQVTVFWTNHGYASAEQFDTLDGAAIYAQSMGFEASFWRGDRFLGSWTVFGGFRKEVR